MGCINTTSHPPPFPTTHRLNTRSRAHAGWRHVGHCERTIPGPSMVGTTHSLCLGVEGGCQNLTKKIPTRNAARMAIAWALSCTPFLQGSAPAKRVPAAGVERVCVGERLVAVGGVCGQFRVENRLVHAKRQQNKRMQPPPPPPQQRHACKRPKSAHHSSQVSSAHSAASVPAAASMSSASIFYVFCFGGSAAQHQARPQAAAHTTRCRARAQRPSLRYAIQSTHKSSFQQLVH
jgi:hypothetical protein